jgi:hypothetical protein
MPELTMASSVRSFILCRSSGLRITEIWNGPAFGAHLPASMIFSRSSAGTGLSRYALTLFLFAIASEISMIFIPSYFLPAGIDLMNPTPEAPRGWCP